MWIWFAVLLIMIQLVLLGTAVWLIFVRRVDRSLPTDRGYDGTDNTESLYFVD